MSFCSNFFYCFLPSWHNFLSCGKAQISALHLDRRNQTSSKWESEGESGSRTISWCSGVWLWLRHCSYTEACWCVQCWYSLWAAPDTCLFPPNRLAEDVNTMNQIPLTNRRACFSRWNVGESSAPRVAPEQTQLFFLSAALKSISDYRLRGGMENLAHANYL